MAELLIERGADVDVNLYCENGWRCTFSAGMPNDNLHSARTAKKDEFYTQLDDIAEELKHYRKHFIGKVVLCNCDDPFESNFAKYFLLNFNDLGLKKLVCTSYTGSPIAEMELPFEGPHPRRRKGRSQIAYLLKVSKIRDITGDGAIGLNDVKKLLKRHPPKLLEGNGDFRSPECIKLLKQADIVVTNPPFSLFREYVAQLMEYKKKFLIIGSQNAITYKEIFHLIKENKIWLGWGFNRGNAYFATPDSESYGDGVLMENGLVKFRNCRWFTNMDHEKRHEELDMIEKYSRKKYPKYDNYKAINVDKVADIPCNYDGVMGVPITFLDKYCPEQFEIIGCSYDYGRPDFWSPNTRMAPVVNGKDIYKRLLIRRK